MANNIKSRIVLALKGAAMGAADVVPGVSGGTIAFITGIYEELIESLQSINFQALRILFRDGFAAFWRHINGSFLAWLFGGIGVSIASLVKGITYLLESYPQLLWSFFFGLIVASILLMRKSVRTWTSGTAVVLVVGTLISAYISTITTVADENTHLGYILLCGMIAICAMILPGISGSFILLLMGAYELIIGTVKECVEAVLHLDLGALGAPLQIAGTFAVGAVLGLVSFSHVLSWLFKRFHDLTIALLIGFLIGSLIKIWPWKQTLTTRIKHEGKPDESVVPFIEDNVWPWNYGQLNEVETGQLGLSSRDPYLVGAILLAVAGIALILILERLGPKVEDQTGGPEHRVAR